MADGRLALKVYEASKDGSESNVRGNESEDIPSKFSYQLATTVNAQTRLGGEVLTVVADIFGLASSLSASATNHVVKLESEEVRAVGHVSKREAQ